MRKVNIWLWCWWWIVGIITVIFSPIMYIFIWVYYYYKKEFISMKKIIDKLSEKEE